MSSWLFIGLCVAVLCPSVNAGNGSALQKEFLESLNAVRGTLLENWASEIQDLRSILIFPVAVAQEFLLEYSFRLPDWSPIKAQLAKFIRNDTQFPIGLDLLQFTEMGFQELAIQTFYNNTLPEMNTTIDDPLYFSYMAFMRWSKEHLDSVAAEREPSHSPLVTVAALRINSIQSENFTWKDKVDFYVSEDQTAEIVALRNVGIYDYAEFDYPKLKNCGAGALRLQVSDELSMVFLIQLNGSDAQCNSSENLLKVFQDVDPETISFKPQRMFVSIPILQVATVVIPAKKLTQMGLLTPEASHTLPVSASNYESAALIFNPEVPKDSPIVMISRDTPRFLAERPFLVAVLQRENPVPVLFGFIQNPNSEFK